MWHLGWGLSRGWRPETGDVPSLAWGQCKEEQALLGMAPPTHGLSPHGHWSCCGPHAVCPCWPQQLWGSPAWLEVRGTSVAWRSLKGRDRMVVSEGLWSPRVMGLGWAGPVQPGPRQQLTSWCSEASPRL